MRHVFVLAALALSCPASARVIEFKVHTFNGVGEADYGRVVAGIDLFVRLAREQCALDIQPVVVRERRQSPGDWNHSYGWQESASPSGPPYAFRYHQRALYELTRRENLPLVAGRIDLFVRHDWHRCAEAFPRIQFLDAESLARNADAPLRAEVLPWVINRVMLVSQSNMGDCGDYTRVVAHELGHLFIQDDPPHHCAAPSGRMFPCEPSNLLADVIPDPRGDYPVVRLANGTQLTPAQCARAASGLAALWDSP